MLSIKVIFANKWDSIYLIVCKFLECKKKIKMFIGTFVISTNIYVYSENFCFLPKFLFTPNISDFPEHLWFLQTFLFPHYISVYTEHFWFIIIFHEQ
jgi:hypothetical protein